MPVTPKIPSFDEVMGKPQPSKNMKNIPSFDEVMGAEKKNPVGNVSNNGIKVSPTTQSPSVPQSGSAASNYSMANSVPAFTVAPPKQKRPIDISSLPTARELQQQNIAPTDQTYSAAASKTMEGDRNVAMIPVWNKQKAERVEKIKKGTPQAIKDAAVKSLKIKGLDPNNKTLLNKAVNDFADQVKSGNAEVDIDHDGQVGLYNNKGFFSSFYDNMMSAINEKKAAREFAKMTPKERVDFVNKRDQEQAKTPYAGEKETELGSVGGMLGGATPTVGTYAAGALAGGLLETLAPETGGLSHLALKPVMSFVFNAGSGANEKGMQGTLERYQKIRRDNPEMDATTAMAKAGEGEDVDRLAGIAEAALFSKMGGEMGEAKTVTGKILKGTANSVWENGRKIAAVEGVRGLGHQLEGSGEKPEEIGTKMFKAFEENATPLALLHLTTMGLTGLVKIPKIINSSAKYDVITKMKPEEVDAALNTAVQKGQITPELAQETVNKLGEFQTALNKVPDNLSEESKASVAGLIVKRDNLKAQAESKDESAKDLHNQEIESINNQIKEIYRTDKPLEHEINEATGEPYKQPTFDDVAKSRVQDVAEKISKGKKIEDAEGLQAQANFPQELDKELSRIQREEKSGNKNQENPSTELSDNIEKYRKQNEKENTFSQPKEKTGSTNKSVSEVGKQTEEEVGKLLEPHENNLMLSGFKTNDEKLKFIAQQAQNISDTGEKMGFGNGRESAENVFGKELVNAAITKFPEKDLLANEPNATPTKINNPVSVNEGEKGQKEELRSSVSHLLSKPNEGRADLLIGKETQKEIISDAFTYTTRGTNKNTYNVDINVLDSKNGTRYLAQDKDGDVLAGAFVDKNNNLTGIVTDKGYENVGIGTNLYKEILKHNPEVKPDGTISKQGQRLIDRVSKGQSDLKEKPISKPINEEEGKSTKPSVISPETIKKEQQIPVTEIGENNGNGAGKEPPPEMPKGEGGEGEGIGITHAQTAELAQEHGFPLYEKDPKKQEEWIAAAKVRIQNGEMPSLLRKMERGDEISPVEQKMMGQYIANLDDEVNKNPSAENLNRLKHAIELSDVVGGRQAGESLVARKGTFLPDDSLGSQLIKEAQSLGIGDMNDMPKEVKDKVISETEEMNKLRDELSQAVKEKEAAEELLRLEKEKKVQQKAEQKAGKKSSRKSHEDFVKERKDLLEELRAAKRAKDEKDKGISKAGLSITLTPEMAKIILKIVKSHLAETSYKLEDLVDKVHDFVKSEGVSKSDIMDVMAGRYNDKKTLPTRNELATNLRELKTEAALLKKLQNERLGIGKEKTVKEKLTKSRRIKELEDKIKEVRDRSGLKEPIAKSNEERIADRSKAIDRKIEQIQKDIKNGIFDKKETPPPVRLDKKTQAKQDRLIELEKQQAIRREKQDYEKMSKFNKAADLFYEVAGLRRFINAAIDFSIMFRQAAPVTTNILKYLPVKDENGVWRKNTAPKAIANMFNLAFSPKGFSRFQYQVEKSEMGRLFTHTKGTFSNPTEIRMEKKEEEFSNNLLVRVRNKIEAGDNEKLKKAADIANTVWFSERAAAGLLNTVRIEEFTKGVKMLQRKGITPENGIKDYEDLTKWVMNLTGRGNLLKMLEDSHAGRIAANRTYFGARLMAAKLNMLNPATYVKMTPAMRVQAIKDIAGYVTTVFLTGLALKAAGASVSLNHDDPDFLQVRDGDKVFDISGGESGYIRTFLRFTSAIAKEIKNPRSRETKSYREFASSSLMKTLVTNKLSPNTAYLYHAFTGKSGGYDENGHLKDFDPTEVFQIYPLYVPGMIQAYKKGGVGDMFEIWLPDMFGVSTQQYDKKGGSGGGGGATGGFPKLQRNTYKPFKLSK